MARDFFVYEFWRFAYVQQEVAKAAQTFLEFPPMQKGASFSMEALKAELEKKMETQGAAQPVRPVVLQSVPRAATIAA